jgi:hypothetical protein
MGARRQRQLIGLIIPVPQIPAITPPSNELTIEVELIAFVRRDVKANESRLRQMEATPKKRHCRHVK